jgi:small subunit ribosomal protein S1
LTEGVEGLVHVSEITSERHIHHPQDVLRAGQIIKAQVLGVDTEKRQIRLSMKQLVPTGLGEYLEEHSEGDVVSGRVVEQSPESCVIELGEGVRAICRTAANAPAAEKNKSDGGVDLSSLTSMLNARWKGGVTPSGSQPEALGVGQIRSFRIVKLDRESERIELALP